MNVTPDVGLASEIQEETAKLYAELEPIAKRFLFERPPPASETAGTPMVLFLGNHSSGKSSFINHLVGDELQRTGIAPVDDGFTIITRGERGVDQDGAALVTNPDLAWSELKGFGSKLVSRLKARSHPSPALQGITLIDSPGMIDAADTSTDRGYDFTGVVRWFAERADVVVFLFDPDKPGTTGETIQVLKDSLEGLDHKLLLVFNKVDRFDAMRDFARAYGALCWNLARAYDRKDLPHIFNTFLPVDESRNRPGALPLEDFANARQEVLEEVRRAPLRRLDNVITLLYNYARRLRMHATVLSQGHAERFERKRSYILIGLAVIAASSAGVYGALQIATESGPTWVAGIVILTVLGLGAVYGAYVWNEKNPTPQDLFEHAYAQKLTLNDEADDLRGLWDTVRRPVSLALKAGGRFGGLSRAERRKLDEVIQSQAPALRSRAQKHSKALLRDRA